MSQIYTSVDQLIGHTPLLALNHIMQSEKLSAHLLAKLEFLNPAGSIKDRVARQMIGEAERSGRLTSDSVIIEPTSGNTGIGLASVAASKGYRVIIVMPDTMSAERRMLMTAYGAELVLSDGQKGMPGAIEKAEELASHLKNSFIAGQFVNPENPRAHYLTTGPEIFEDTDGLVDMVVAGIGTGGTVTGIGRFLKEKKPAIQMVGVEPADSAVLSGGRPGQHGLQGLGAGFIPEVLDVSVIDEVMQVTTEDAYRATRLLGKQEGILAGISSGAALSAAILQAKRSENQGKTIVAILPDTGDRYLSTGLFNSDKS